MAIVRPETSAFFENIRADKLFLGVENIDLKGGLMVPELNEAHTKRAMANSAKEIIAVADHSKIGRSTLVTIVPLSKVTTLITGRETESTLLDDLKAHVTVIPV